MALVGLKEFRAPEKAKAGASEAPFNAASAPNISVSMSTDKKFGDGTPVNSLMIKQRREILKEWFGESWKEGSLGTVYKAWLYVILCAIAVVVFYGINLWIAAVFAYLAGYLWSCMLVNYAWSVQWFKGKALIETK